MKSRFMLRSRGCTFYVTLLVWCSTFVRLTGILVETKATVLEIEGLGWNKFISAEKDSMPFSVNSQDSSREISANNNQQVLQPQFGRMINYFPQLQLKTQYPPRLQPQLVPSPFVPTSAANQQVYLQQFETRPSFQFRPVELYQQQTELQQQLAANINSNINYNVTPSLGRNSLRKALLGLQNPRLLGGDILVRTGSRRVKPARLLKHERSALVSPISLWPSGVIFYELDPSVDHLNELIWKAMQQFHDETCIKFIPRKHNHPDYLRIEALKGCFSYIGRIGGEQTLSLGDGCEYRGTIAHELLHAVGFYHHQNRSDRDDFLEILWDNIARGKENQFRKMSPQENMLLNSFDYDSIMLYGPRTFGKTLDKVTMKPKRDGVILLEVIEKQGLSTLDIDSVNKLYQCKEGSQK